MIINDSQDIINSGSKQKKIGDHFGVDISFLRLYNYITFSLHIAISEQRDTSFNGTQPVLLALCLPFTCFDFFACFSWKLRSETKRN